MTAKELQQLRPVIRGILCAIAGQGVVITYTELAGLLGLKPNVWLLTTGLPDELGEISVAEKREGRPFLSVVVVGESGICGDGFFALARRERLVYPGKSNPEFFIAELRRTHKFWKAAKNARSVKAAHA